MGAAAVPHPPGTVLSTDDGDQPIDEPLDVLVVGAGQAGLATGYWLQQRAGRLRVALLDAAPEIGQSWLQRWDSLRLFTPRGFSALPGLAFPSGAATCPDRGEMADYLRSYAEHFALPIRLGVAVEQVTAVDDGFAVRTSQGTLIARQVVVATGPFHDPLVPAAAATGLDPSVQQLHSYFYRSPADIRGEDVVVVGGGNSAAQIALELRKSRRVVLVMPRSPWFVPARILGLSSYRWMTWLGILDADVDGPVVRHVRRRGDAIFGRTLKAPLRRGEVQLRVARVMGGEGEHLVLSDGSTLAASAVVWCTGFHARYPWLQVPGALDTEGNPVHQRGASPVAGLHWMGLPWQNTLSSSIVHGVSDDACACVDRIGEHDRLQYARSRVDGPSGQRQRSAL